jgi:hypothetical protein
VISDCHLPPRRRACSVSRLIASPFGDATSITDSPTSRSDQGSATANRIRRSICRTRSAEVPTFACTPESSERGSFLREASHGPLVSGFLSSTAAPMTTMKGSILHVPVRGALPSQSPVVAYLSLRDVHICLWVISAIAVLLILARRPERNSTAGYAYFQTEDRHKALDRHGQAVVQVAQDGARRLTNGTSAAGT